MAKKFLTSLGLVSLASDPVSGTEGELYYNNVSDTVRLYKNGAWTDLSSTGALPSGGATGQILAKSSNTDYAVEWIENYADYTETVKLKVKNDGTRALYKGQPVYVTGSDGTNVLVGRSSNITEGGSSKTIGLLEENLATNGQGFVVKEGKLGTLDTSTAGAVGDPVWLGVDGALIYGLANKPYAPAHLVYLGVVTKKNGSTGEIFVQVQNGFELQELHNVGIGYSASIQNNEVLAYDDFSGIWINKTSAEAGLIDTSATEQTKSGNLIIGGNLTVNGTTTTLNTENLNVEDNIITLNSGVSGSPSLNSGIEIERGISDNVSILWNESSDKWTLTNNGTTSYPIATQNGYTYDSVINIRSFDGINDGSINLETYLNEIQLSDDDGVIIRTNSGSSTFAFNNSGELQFPDASIQDTAFLGMSSYSTTNLSEGSRLYFTNQRAVDALTSTLTNYLTNSSANSTYLTKASASSTYQPIISVGDGLTLTGSTVSVNPGAMLNKIVDGTSGNSYGLVGTSAYLDVKDTNGYNKEIELDITAVESKLVTDGFLTSSAASVIYQPIGSYQPSGSYLVASDLSGYLTQSSASTTYLTQSSASTTYLTQSSASTTYLTQSSASTAYLTKSSASTTYQPLDAELTAIAGLTSAADRLPYFTGSETASLTTFTTFGRSLIDDADATAARTTLGLGTMATATAADYLTMSSASTTYLTQSSASTTYAKLSGAAFTGDISTTGVLKSIASAANEGGQVELSVPSSGTTLSGTNVTIDVYQDKLRIFESGGTNRGVYIPLTSAAATVGTSLLGGTAGAMNYAQTAATKQSGVSSAGTTLVSVSITTNGYPIQVIATGDMENNSAGGWVTLQLYRGSTAVGNIVHAESSAGSENVPFALNTIDAPAAGTYTYSLKINTSAGGTFNFGESNGPVITAVELSGPKGDTGATGAAGSSPNSFTTISVSGQSDVVADSSTDTLTLTAGTGITLTTNATTDAVTIGVTGSTYQPLDADLTALAGLTSAANALPYFTGLGTASTTTLSSFGRTLIDDADATSARTTLGLGTMATAAAADYLTTSSASTTYLTQSSASTTYLTQSSASTAYQPLDAELTAIAGLTSAADRLPYFTGSGTASLATFTTFGRSLVDDADAVTARTTLGLAIGTNVQAYDPELTAIAGLTSAADSLPYFTGSGTASLATFTTFGRSLVDDADAATARTTLGLGTMATATAADYLTTSSASTTYLSQSSASTTYQPLDAELTAIAALTSAADRLPYFTGSGTASLATFTTFGRSLVDDADANAARTTLGLGTMATATASDYASLSGATFTGDIAVNGGDITTTSTTATLYNSNATTIDIGGSASAISIGSTAHTGTTTINNNLSVYGSITFAQGSSSLSSTTIQIDDTLISLSDNNTADILDIGLFAGYRSASVDYHTGLVRDASDSGIWKLFSGVSAQPTDTVDFTSALYDILKVKSLQVTDAATTRTNLGLGTIATRPSTDFALLGSANAFTVGGHVVTTESASVVPLILKGASSQTANLQEWQTSAGAANFFIGPSGQVRLATSNTIGAIGGAGSQIRFMNNSVTITTNLPANPGLYIQGAASQVNSLQEWQDSGGSPLASVSSSGNITAASFIKTSGTSSQFLKADGSVDSSTYLTTGSASTTYQLLDSELTALAGLTSAADRLPYFTGSGTASLATFTTFGRSLVDDADAATARTTLGLAIGTNVQPWDQDLTDIAALTANGILRRTAGVWAMDSATYLTSAVTSITAGTGLSGGTITSTGTVALATAYGDTTNPYASKTANYVLASPNGTAGAPTFRALVAADIPTLNQNTTGSAATLATPRAIYGNNFDGSAALTQVIAATYGGTGNGFTAFSGPATSTKTFTLPNATATILTDNAAVTLTQGGTNASLTASNGGIVYSTATAMAILAGTATAGQVLRSGASGAPSWSAYTLPTSVTANQALYASSTTVVTAGTLPVAAGGTNASSAGITAFNNITGYTASGATGTTSTNIVFSTSPTITTPTIDTINTSLTTTGTAALFNTGITTGTISIGGALTTGSINIGSGTAGAKTITIGTSTGSVTLNGTVNAALLDLTTAATATTATSYFVETGSDGIVRPKTLANVKTELIGNAFTTFSGPTTSAKTFTLPDATATILTTNAAVTAAQGGTGQSSYTVGDILYASTTSALSKLAASTSGYVLTSNGAGVAPSWQAAAGGSSFTTSAGLAALLSDETGSGSAVFATSPTLTTPVISGGTINNASIGATTASTGKFTSVDINGQAIIEGSTGTISATSSFNTTTYSSAEFIVYGSTSTGNYVSKVLMLARGTATPVITEYAILTQGTAPAVTITPSYSAPNAVLTVAVTSGTNIEIIATKVSI